LKIKLKKELIERLKTGTYSDIYNFDEETFKRALDDEEIEEDQVDEKQFEYVAEEEEEDLDMEPPLESGNDFLDENDVEDFGAYIDSGFDEADFNFNALQEESIDSESPGNEKQATTPKKTNTRNNKGQPKKVARTHLEIEYDNNSQREREVNEDS